jgi:phage terminase large subunit-like protein
MFSEQHAQKAERFFERILTHTKGRYARTKFILHPWERKVIRDLFGNIRGDGKTRQYTQAYIEIGKKNGKSELGAGLALYGLIADGEAGAEVISAASTRDQASIMYGISAQMVRNHEYLSGKIKRHDSTKSMQLADDPSSVYKVISADADTNDGINPSMAIFDELHRQKTYELYNVLYRGMRENSLFIMLTNAGVVGESELCWEKHEYARQLLEGVFQDPSFYPCIHSLGIDEDWQEEGHPEIVDKRGTVISPATGWYKANPALGDYLSLDKLREEYKIAIRNPVEQNDFRRFRLTQWTSQEFRAIDLKNWDACGDPFNEHELIGKICYGGMDLSTSIDITAWVKTFPVGDEFWIVPKFFVPESEVKNKTNKGDKRYELWQKRGLLTVTPGNVIDFRIVRKQIEDDSELYDLREIGHDPWNATEIVQNLIEYGLTMVPIRQTFPSMSGPTKMFFDLILKKRIRHNGNPVLRWMADCLTVSQDRKDNVIPSKPDRKKSSKRIDGIVASIMGIDRAIRNKPKVSVYETGDLKIL